MQFLSASPFEQGEGSQPADIQSQRRNCPRIIIPLMQTAAEPSSKHGKEQNLGHDVPPHLMQIHPSVRSSPRGMSMSGGMITNAEPNPVRPKQDSQARQPVPGTKTIPSSSNRSGRLNQPDCTGSQVSAGPPLRFHLVAIVAARLRDDATDLYAPWRATSSMRLQGLQRHVAQPVETRLPAKQSVRVRHADWAVRPGEVACRH